MRSFIAIEIPQDIKRALGGVLEELRKVYCDVKWVEPGSVHLTLKFLGEIDPEKVLEIKEALKKPLEGHRPFSLIAEGLGAFPRLESPRVVWVGLRGDLEKLAALQKDVEKTLSLLGFPEEDRPFKPHLTLGRMRSQKGREALVKRLREMSSKTLGSFRVDCLAQFRSELLPTGAKYTVLWKEGLGNLEGE